MRSSVPRTPEVCRLGLRVDTLPGCSIYYPVLTVLVDGRDLIGELEPGFRGFIPDEMLGRASPLLPRDHARRVAIACCSCRIASCGVVAPRITERIDGLIEWTDFRRFTGFGGPTTDGDPIGGAVLPQPDLVFSFLQYALEIGRATADLRWKSTTLATPQAPS